MSVLTDTIPCYVAKVHSYKEDSNLTKSPLSPQLACLTVLQKEGGHPNIVEMCGACISDQASTHCRSRDSFEKKFTRGAMFNFENARVGILLTTTYMQVQPWMSQVKPCTVYAISSKLYRRGILWDLLQQDLPFSPHNPLPTSPPFLDTYKFLVKDNIFI